MSHDHDHHHGHQSTAATPGTEAPQAEKRPPKQEQEPASEDVTELAPGVLRSQLPVSLPGLGHVNCYLLEDDQGVALVDPGLPDDASWKALQHRLAQAGYTPDNVHTVLVTHSHFDHYGNAWRLREAHGARIVAHTMFNDEFDDDDTEFLDFEDDGEAEDARPPWESNPVTAWGTRREAPPDIVAEQWKQRIDEAGPGLRAPTADLRLDEGATITLARREWVAVHTPGHTKDHLCLYDPVEGVMLSGDHVLPTITPHIGANHVGDDMLNDFFASLQRMHEFADARLVLPAHGHPFEDLAGRSDYIRDHHIDRLGTIMDNASNEPATVNDFMRELFRERSWGYMAERETFAHLEYLRVKGDLASSWHGELLAYTSGV